MEHIVAIDKQITLFVNGLYSVPTDWAWQFFSSIKVWFPMYAAIAAVLFWRLGWKRGLIALAALVLTVIFCDAVANFVKGSVCRLRPLHDPSMVGNGLHILERGGGPYGFFSGHAANSVAFATGSRMLLRQDTRLEWKGYTCWIFIWATLVSISRIFVGKHFFGDVVAGALFGAATGYAIARLAILVSGKIGKRPEDGTDAADDGKA